MRKETFLNNALSKNQKKIMIILSCFSLFLLLFSFSVFGLFVNPIVCLILCKNLLREKEDCAVSLQLVEVLFVLMVCATLFIRFYNKWSYSILLESICSAYGIQLKPLVIIGGLVLTFVSFLAVCRGIKRMIESFKTDSKQIDLLSRDEKKAIIIICIISAFGIIGVCSKSSFIYPFNDWNDANCFFTVGKSMVNGIVPYRDLFEQKGPLLYLMHGIAWFVSHDSFLGVYFLESICATIYLYYSYKIIRLFFNKKASFIIPLMAAICYTAFTFKDGDSAEELSLPFLVISIYSIVKAQQSNESITKGEAILIGIMSGCIFWIKFSLIGMYIGWFIAFIIVSLRKGSISELLNRSIYIALGVIVATIPFVIYFGVNNAIMDWFKVYIYDNLFLYSEEKTSIINNLNFGLSQFAEKNKTVFNLCLIVVFASLCKKEKSHFILLTSMIVFEFLLIYLGGKHYRYYSFVMNAFIPLGVAYICKLFETEITKIGSSNLTTPVITICCILFSFYITPNRYLFGVSREEMPQYHFAKIINKEKNNATLLNYYCLDGGFYTAANIIPNCKAFCKLNMDLQEMYDLQERYVQEGLIDYVVSKGEFNFEKYKLIETMTFPYNDTTQTFYLYKLK